MQSVFCLSVNGMRIQIHSNFFCDRTHVSPSLLGEKIALPMGVDNCCGYPSTEESGVDGNETSSERG
jgi:hypothetical protein